MTQKNENLKHPRISRIKHEDKDPNPKGSKENVCPTTFVCVEAGESLCQGR